MGLFKNRFIVNIAKFMIYNTVNFMTTLSPIYNQD
jgi:hypothetical protein